MYVITETERPTKLLLLKIQNHGTAKIDIESIMNMLWPERNCFGSLFEIFPHHRNSSMHFKANKEIIELEH